MRNTKEVQAILSAIYCINLSKRKEKDSNIEKIYNYAFNRLFGGNANLLILSCVGKTKEQIWKKSIKCCTRYNYKNSLRR
ncbi:MAG: hypothetical protein K2G37_05810 [Clostridia bacterium]|nr:hypothetical protein [Clostridia bacterium]MDE7329256.1 hypothetical protein [Clostridia bacterium]